MSNRRVIVALDFPDADQAMATCQRLSPYSCRLKVGKELFTSAGPALVSRLQDAGFDIFLDLKYNDIPNTVAQACKAAANLGVWMLSVHASSGKNALYAAREAIDKSDHKPLLIAVTVLTGMSDKDLTEIGMHRSVEQQVMHMAAMAKDAGFDGVVCSAREASRLQHGLGADFCLVTPGIRNVAIASDDQKRIMTPSEAVRAGSHYLVIGRPVIRADDPLAVLEAINAEISSCL